MREWFISLVVTLFFLPSDIYYTIKQRWLETKELTYLVELEEPEKEEEDE